MTLFLSANYQLIAQGARYILATKTKLIFFAHFATFQLGKSVSHHCISLVATKSFSTLGLKNHLL